MNLRTTKQIAVGTVALMVMAALAFAGCGRDASKPAPIAPERTTFTTLAEALEQRGESDRIKLFEIHSEVREAVDASANATLRFFSSVGPDSELRFAHAVADRDWSRATTSVAFAVFVREDDGSMKRIYRSEQRLDHNLQEPWDEARVGLDAYAGRTVEIVLQASLRRESAEVPTTPYEGRPVWSHVRVVTRKPSKEKGPNVLWITLDTTRADHLSAYGYGRPTSPNIDALAARGTLYEHAFSNAPWTRPSVTSMMMSQYPHKISTKTRFNDNFTVDVQWPSLPSELRRAGYWTSAFINAPTMDFNFGFGRGFNRYEQTGNDTFAVQHFARWIEQRDKSRPYFAYFHLLAAHAVYEHVEGVTAWPYPSPDRARDLGNRFPGANEIRENPPNAEELAELISLYDGEILAADRRVGEVLEILRRDGELDHTYIVVTADHGEEFGEHGGWEHGHALYDEQIRVPLIIVKPGQTEGRRDARTVALVDVAPTLMRALGFTPPDSFVGRDLFAESGFADRPVLSENILVGPHRSSLRTAEMKYIFPLGDGAEEIFDPRSDPAEKQNLAADNGSLAKARQMHATFYGGLKGDARERVARLRFMGRAPHKWKMIYRADRRCEPVFISAHATELVWKEDEVHQSGTVEFSTTPDKPMEIRLPISDANKAMSIALEVDGRKVNDREIVVAGSGSMEPSRALADLTNREAGQRLSVAVPPETVASMELVVTAAIWDAAVPQQLFDQAALLERLKSLGYIQ
ncbi:MAG: sulfatase [Deltaproteobacteria bacterium]|nr:sulfatase [Deltaproteobacteria bacterium]